MVAAFRRTEKTPVAKVDITELTKAADDLLGIVENPRHRRILENYRRHSLLEVTGRWQDIFAPDMTVEHPIYFLNVSRSSVTLDGFEEVSGFYRTLVDGGSNVILLQDEQLAVADWGFAKHYSIRMSVAARFQKRTQTAFTSSVSESRCTGPMIDADG